MRNISLRKLCAIGLLTLCLGAPRLSAAITFTLYQAGPDVVLSGSGSANLEALEPIPDDFMDGLFSNATGGLNPSQGVLAIGTQVPQPVNNYSGVSSAISFGLGGDSAGVFRPTSASGDYIGIIGSGLFDPFPDGALVVPDGYVSGAPLSGTAIFANHTFQTLGINPGTYTWTWGEGAGFDSVTLIAVSAVPEPATWSAFAGAAALGLVFCRRRATA